jgi:hypothetical protein
MQASNFSAYDSLWEIKIEDDNSPDEDSSSEKEEEV